MNGKILRNYVSEIDQLIQDFDKKHPRLSQSQQKEIAKFEQIYFLRDTENRPKNAKRDFESLL